MRMIIASLTAAGLLVGGAFVASTMVSTPADAQEADTQVSHPGVEARHRVVEEVLSDLVADGTLTQAQADTVEYALADKAEELRAQREADREMIREFLEDDVISSDELRQLGDDHPFNDPDGPFADAAEDGEITRDELRELRREHRHPHRMGAPDEEASTPSA